MRTLVLLLLFLAACGHNEPKEKLRIGLNPWPGYLDLAVAEHEGIFAAHGFDVHIVEYTSLHDMARAYQLGQIDFMPSTLVEVLEVNQGRRSAEVIWVADASDGADVALAKDATSVADLRGKRIAYEPNSLGIFVLARMLDRAGLKVQDVDAIGMDQTEMVLAMKEGRIEAAITYPPASLSIRELPGIATVFSSAEIPDEVIDVFCVDPDILDADPTFLNRFYAVMADTAEFARRNPKTAIGHKCRQMGIEPSAWESAAKGVRYFELKDQHEWIWGSDRIHTIHARLADVIRATCGPRRDPVRPIHAGHRFAPELIAPAAPR